MLQLVPDTVVRREMVNGPWDVITGGTGAGRGTWEAAADCCQKKLSKCSSSSASCLSAEAGNWLALSTANSASDESSQGWTGSAEVITSWSYWICGLGPRPCESPMSSYFTLSGYFKSQLAVLEGNENLFSHNHKMFWWTLPSKGKPFPISTYMLSTVLENMFL